MTPQERALLEQKLEYLRGERERIVSQEVPNGGGIKGMHKAMGYMRAMQGQDPMQDYQNRFEADDKAIAAYKSSVAKAEADAEAERKKQAWWREQEGIRHGNRQQIANTLTGQKQAAADKPRHLPSGEVAKIAEADANIAQLDDIEAILTDKSENLAEALGPYDQLAGRLDKKTGGAIGLPFVDENKAQKVSAQVGNFATILRNAIFGASLTENELAAAKQYLPHEDDSLEQLIYKKNLWKQYYQRLRDAKVGAFGGAGYNVGNIPQPQGGGLQMPAGGETLLFDQDFFQ